VGGVKREENVGGLRPIDGSPLVVSPPAAITNHESQIALPALLAQQDRDGMEEDRELQQERLVLDVQAIVFDFVSGFEIVEGSDLGQSCQFRFDRQPDSIERLVPLDEVRPFRA
jgi:hypothetical protein